MRYWLLSNVFVRNDQNLPCHILLLKYNVLLLFLYSIDLNLEATITENAFCIG